jgi:tRNA threonylcarbamoyladenosine dehydratase
VSTRDAAPSDAARAHVDETSDAVVGFESLVASVDAPECAPAESWRPLLLRLTADRVAPFFRFCADRRIGIFDSIERQLDDLAMVRDPSATPNARRRFVDQELESAVRREAYGTWAWFPWCATMVHLLDRDDYFDVITNRNQDKITRDEQLRLRQKRVGVVGLSVGGEAAVTVAQEHLCGHIVLADFDRLDLSNLNRLGAGCDELGLLKTHIVARRIAKIDPYVRVTVLDEGVTSVNAERFLEGLDLVIEECDGLPMKRHLRLLCKARRIDVVFAADERGFLSVEPYGSVPDLPPFHGRVEQPQPTRESFETPLAYMQALALWMGGWEQLSERSRASLACLGERLCGYPQLASEARFTAGQLGHVARRLLSGDRLAPFIGNVDLDLLLPTTSSST